jgi:hypothetical protein
MPLGVLPLGWMLIHSCCYSLFPCGWVFDCFIIKFDKVSLTNKQTPLPSIIPSNSLFYFILFLKEQICVRDIQRIFSKEYSILWKWDVQN